MLESFLQVLGENAVAIVMPIVGAVFSWVGIVLKKNLDLASIKTSLEIHKAVAKSAVAFVEQVGESLEAKDKFAKAKATAVESLNIKGIAVNVSQLDMLIEQAVHNLSSEIGWSGINSGVEYPQIDIYSDAPVFEDSLAESEPAEFPEDFSPAVPSE